MAYEPPEIQTRLSSIDQWRGISVLMVIVHHLVDFRYRRRFDVDYRLSDFIRNPGGDHLLAAVRRVFYLWSHNVGPLGVQIFFVISGYIITRLLLKEQKKLGTVCLACFYIRRAFRILPALILFVLVTEIISVCGFISVPSADAGSVATFLCNTTLVTCGYYFGHLWSLCVEEQFYLVWPLVFVFAIGTRRTHLIWLVLTACMTISVFPTLWVSGWINNGLSFGCIAAGAAYALSERFRSVFLFATKWPVWLLIIILVIVLPLIKSFAVSLWALTTVITPLVIVAVVLTRADIALVRERNRISWWLNQVGRMSYSLYLWHEIFIWEPERYHSSRFLIASLPLGLALAWLSATYVEPFFIRHGRTLAGMADGHPPIAAVDV
jgi:peptidoglycan/LPS O-acetylase OafA/YrhL